MPTPQYHRASSRRRRRGNRSSTDRAADPREPHTRDEPTPRNPLEERASDTRDATRTDEAASEAVQESESCALLQPARSGDTIATDEDVPALLTRRPASP